MRVVWKYQFADVMEDIGIPAQARIVHVGEQYGKVCVWAEVDGTGVGYVRDLVIIGTGHPVPDHYDHVGTVVLPPFVWHVYAATISPIPPTGDRPGAASTALVDTDRKDAHARPVGVRRSRIGGGKGEIGTASTRLDPYGYIAADVIPCPDPHCDHGLLAWDEHLRRVAAVWVAVHSDTLSRDGGLAREDGSDLVLSAYDLRQVGRQP